LIALLLQTAGIAVACTPAHRRIPEGLQEVAAVTVLQTPEPGTGLGTWTDEQIAAAIRSGARQHGSGRLIVMSWPLYRGMSDADVNSIVAYLRSIPPVEHKVPTAVTPGTKAPAPYVHFSVYRSNYYCNSVPWK